MFKEYDKNTYKEKEVKDRTPFRTAFKKVWNDVNVWRVLLFMFIALIYFLGSGLKTNAAESNVYVDSEYMQEQFGNYPYYLIVTDGSGNYMTLYSSAQICYSGSTFRAFCTNHYYGYKTMKVVDDYLVIDESGSSSEKWSSISVVFSYEGVPTSCNTIIYASKDIYNTGTSNTGSPTIGSTVIHSVANNIGSKPVDDSTDSSTDIIVSTDLTEVLTYLDEILVCLKAIFSTLSIILFFLVAEWTANKVKNIVRRFSRYE